MDRDLRYVENAQTTTFFSNTATTTNTTPIVRSTGIVWDDVGSCHFRQASAPITIPVGQYKSAGLYMEADADAVYRCIGQVSSDVAINCGLTFFCAQGSASPTNGAGGDPCNEEIALSSGTGSVIINETIHIAKLPLDNRPLVFGIAAVNLTTGGSISPSILGQFSVQNLSRINDTPIRTVYR